jgi:hypothetical protein
MINERKPIEAFPVTFQPANNAVHLLALVANDAEVRLELRLAAELVLTRWREALATPEQREATPIEDGFELDTHGACVSQGDGGFWIQTWTWIEEQP